MYNICIGGVIMDMFYRQENIHVFKRWVFFQIQNDKRLRFEVKDENTYSISYKNKTATYTIWPMGVIEETIEEHGEVIFYLHFKFTYLFHQFTFKIIPLPSSKFQRYSLHHLQYS